MGSLFISANPIGRGHTERMIRLSKELGSSHDIHLAGGGSSCNSYREHGFENVYEVPEISWYETRYGLNIPLSMANVMYLMPTFDLKDGIKVGFKSPVIMEYIQCFYSMRLPYERVNPTLTISDGCYVSMRLALRRDKNAVYIGNLFMPDYIFKRIGPLKEKIENGYLMKCKERICPDLPGRFTITEGNIGISRNKIKFVGPFVEMNKGEGGEDHILVIAGGTYHTKMRMLRIKEILDDIHKKTGIQWKMTLGLNSLKGYEEVTDAHEICGWVSDRKMEDWLSNSKFVIGNGGHTLIFENVSHGKPGIYLTTQMEQYENAKKCERLGIGIQMKERELFTKLAPTVDELSKHNWKKQKMLKNNALKIKEVAGEIGSGVQNAAEIINEY